MGLLADYRKKRQKRRRKRDDAQAEARKSLHDEPSATRRGGLEDETKPPGLACLNAESAPTGWTLARPAIRWVDDADRLHPRRDGWRGRAGGLSRAQPAIAGSARDDVGHGTN